MTCKTLNKNKKIMSTQKKQTNWKRIMELIAALATMIASFIGGQAAAQNGVIDMFNKNQIENHGK